MTLIETAISFAQYGRTKTEDDEELKEFYRMLEEALIHQRERENAQPLTLEELKQMDGQPVWIVKNGEVGKWFIFEVLVWSKSLYAGDKFNFDFYGETWLAYRYPPKEADNAAESDS